MMKLFRLLQTSRSTMTKGLLYAKEGNLSEGLGLHCFTSSAGFSTAGKSGSQESISVSYTIFKGKAALAATPVLPTFTKLDSGTYVVDRKGCILLRFTPAIGERKYDREKMQVFALSSTEVGSLISLGANDSCELFHDPSMKSSNAGQVRKSLSIKAHSAGDGYMISLTIANNILKTRENMTVPVTTAEFTVLKTACSYALPHILGWDQMIKKKEGLISSSSPFKADHGVLDSDWEK